MFEKRFLLLPINIYRLTKRTMTDEQRKIIDPKGLIGKREIVGFGYNGQPNYVDRNDFPMPAIRWRAPTPEICALREKEKGDWRKLTIDEKKALYRASYCQTFAEFQKSLHQWKGIAGVTFMLVSIGLWCYYFVYSFVYHGIMPESFSEEYRAASLRRIIDLKVDPIRGLCSEWDYEKDRWK